LILWRSICVSDKKKGTYSIFRNADTKMPAITPPSEIDPRAADLVESDLWWVIPLAMERPVDIRLPIPPPLEVLVALVSVRVLVAVVVLWVGLEIRDARRVGLTIVPGETQPPVRRPTCSGRQQNQPICAPEFSLEMFHNVQVLSAQKGVIERVSRHSLVPGQQT
jgi:hypothetical protein